MGNVGWMRLNKRAGTWGYAPLKLVQWKNLFRKLRLTLSKHFNPCNNRIPSSTRLYYGLTGKNNSIFAFQIKPCLKPFSNPTRVWRRMSLTDIFNNKRMWSNCNPIKDDGLSFQESSLTNFTLPCLLHYLDPTWYSQVSTKITYMWLLGFNSYDFFNSKNFYFSHKVVSRSAIDKNFLWNLLFT